MYPLIHGGDIYSAHLRISGHIVDFSANVNPLGMPEKMKEVLVARLAECEHYPDPLCRRLTAAIAGKENVAEQHILCGNGASDLIYRFAYALRPKCALLAAPCFAEYENALAATGCSIQRHHLQESDAFALTERILPELTDEIDLLFLCSPNNPTGQPIERKLLEAILNRCTEKGIFLAIDECFNDFLDHPEQYTCKDMLVHNERLMIFRAFTKMYAIPGLRLGYCFCSDRDLMNQMYACGSPWSVSSLAQEAGLCALEEDSYVARTKELIQRERAFLIAGLQQLGCRVYGSHANYIFFRPKCDGLLKALDTRGILVRDCNNFTGLESGFLRIAVKGHTDNQLLLWAIEEVVACR